MTFALSTRSGQRIVVDHGRIADPALDCSPEIFLGDSVLIPGLINAHDHLYLNHYPRLGTPPYPNAYAWGRDLHARFDDEIRRLSALPRKEALLFGALKNLLGGVTTVVHHDPWDATLDRFPLRVSRVRVAHSIGFERDWGNAVAGDHATSGLPLSMHLAEGSDPAAAAEVHEAHARGILDGRFLAVHVVGLTGDGVSLFAASGAAAVWCPSSNRFLLGRTAPPALLNAGIDVLLGTDALLTGDGTMLAELKEARRWGHLDDRRLELAVGTTAARRLGLPAPGLEPGQPADLVCLRRPLFESCPADVALVMVGGSPRVADPALGELFHWCGVPAETLQVEDTVKLVAAPLATIAAQVFALSPQSRRILSC